MPEIVRNLPERLGGIVLLTLLLAVVHVHIDYFGPPVVTPSAYLVWIGMAAVIFLAAVQIARASVYVSPWLTVYAFLFIALSLVTTAVNPVLDQHAFFFETAGLIAGILYFIALHQFRFPEDFRERLLYAVLISGAIEAGFGLVQYLSLPLNIPYLPTAGFGGTGAAYGVFEQTNLLASYLATALVVSLYLLGGSGFGALSTWTRTGFYALIALITMVLLLGQSRAAMAGAALGIVMLLVVHREQHRAAPRRVLLFWFLALAIGLGGSLVIAKEYGHEYGVAASARKLERLFGAYLGGAREPEERLVMYRVTLEMFKDRPVLGQGRGSFAGQYMFYRRDLSKRLPDIPATASFTDHPHNEFLYILAESGLVGGLGFLIVVSAAGVMLYRLGRRTGGGYAALLLPLALYTQTEFPFYISTGHWMLFLTLLALPSGHFVRAQAVPLPRWGRTSLALGAAIVLLLAGWFLVETLRAHNALTRYVMGASPMRALPAVGNPYLGQVAERILAINTARAVLTPREARILDEKRLERLPALTAGEKQLLEDFAAYARNERRIAPLPSLYAWEARALYALGRADDAFGLLDEGQSLYLSDSQVLKQSRQQLIAMDLKLRLSRHLPGRH